ncbi:hypothetical protein HHI36_016139 [Cryptolaemus montrouzieri]|uniref:MADF domain-containing protein n=1 Tax=Cryptolaemus montrouzieri TaxID=559131 RepID=A0ABD2NIM5_9CUCU
MDKQQCLKLIQLYSSHRRLWDPQCPDYSNKGLREDAWSSITREMDIPTTELKKKMVSLLGSYRREKSREKKSRTTDSDRDVYKSNWYAYDALSFLGDRNHSGCMHDTFNEEELADAGPDLANSSSVDSLSSVTDKTKFLTNHNQSAKRLKLSTESTENEATSSKESLPSLIPFNSAEKNNVARQIADKSENHFTVISTWCDLLQCKLKEFDEYTREFLMNQIDNYVFRARVKQLKQKKEERKKMEASAGSYVHPVHSIQHVHPLYVDVASTSGLNSNQNRNQDNDKSNVSPTGSHSSLIEIKEERVDIDEEF